MAARSQLQTFLWSQKLWNLKSEIIQIYYHILHHMEMCRWLLLKFKMAATDQLQFFLVSAEIQNNILVIFF